MKSRLSGFTRTLEMAADRFRGDDAGWCDFVTGLPPRVVHRLLEEWHWQAHGGQQVPPGDWTVWLLMAGRGFGKTRAGAEWVWGKVRKGNLGTSLLGVPKLPELRIALVGATREDAVRVMVEGPSGLINVARAGEEIRWVPTRGELALPGGARAFVYSAEAPEGLRGPEHHFAWVDELGKWPVAPLGRDRGAGDEAWDNLMMGLRLAPLTGSGRPQAMVTTTPRATALLKRVRALPGTVETGGRTAENPHLPDAFKAWAAETYGGTRLGRQELDGVLIEEVEGSLFPLSLIEAARILPGTGRGTATRSGVVEGARGGTLQRLWAPSTSCAGPPPRSGEDFRRVVVGVDPPASAGGDACGIVVCGLLDGVPPAFARAGAPGLAVLADHSVQGLRPDGWARAVARAAEAWGADRVVAEKNQGGEMVAAVLRSADCLLPVRLVHASRGKSARAEPIAALMEAGRIKLLGHFHELEAELNGLMAGGGYQGPGRSPDRADACIWALWALIEGAGRREPRVVAL